jgi:hypothetical protein
MKNFFGKIKAASILMPAVFLMEIWILTLSNGSLVEQLGLLRVIGYAVLVSFGVSYSVVMFVEVAQGRARPN